MADTVSISELGRRIERGRAGDIGRERPEKAGMAHGVLAVRGRGLGDGEFQFA